MKYFLGFFVLLTTSMAPIPEEFIKRHECRPKAEISCIVETSPICPPGYYDGCLTGETNKHQCVVSNDGPSCDLDMNMSCPENFEDGCRLGQTTIHTCVPIQGELCTDDAKLTCPSEFEDSCF